MAIIPKGREPANVKKRIDTLFPKLDEAYPDRVIRRLEKDHHKWAETTREISKQLGYDNKDDFLTAYGYKIEKLESGRPSGDHMAIIDELKKRYPSGSPFTKIDELKEANPDLAPKFKTIANNSKELFGMTFVEYLKSIGIISCKAIMSKREEINHIKFIEKKTSCKKNVDKIVNILKVRYSQEKPVPTSVKEIKENNPDLMMESFDSWCKIGYSMSATAYLESVGILDKEKLHAQKLKDIAANKPPFGVLEIAGRNFVSSGLYDKQRIFDHIILKLGGNIKNYVDYKTDYIVINNNYKYDSSAKIRKAQALIKEGAKIQILCYSNFMQKIFQIDNQLSESKIKELLYSKYNQIVTQQDNQLSETVIENHNPQKIRVAYTKENSTLFIPDEQFNIPKIEIDYKLNVANAVFRGVDQEVDAAINSLKTKPEKKIISAEISEFDLFGEEEVLFILKRFPNLKAAMFIEQRFFGEVYTAYSRSGYSHITDLYFAGSFDPYEMERWTFEYLPTKSFETSTGVEDTDEYSNISYEFLMEDDWESFNYIVCIDGELRQLIQPDAQ